MSDKGKILKLIVRNVERVKAVEIDAAGRNVVEVAGRNAAGKTSILNAIMSALGGARDTSAEPIRRGADQAITHIEFDGLTVDKVIEDGKTSLVVTDARGKVRSPQTMLDELCGRSSLFKDPLAFSTMKPMEQLSLLKQIVGVDFADLDERRNAMCEERTAAGRDVSARKAQIDSMEDYPDAPAEEIVPALVRPRLADVSDLVRQIDDANQVNEKNAKRRADLRRREFELRQLRGDMEKAAAQLSAWKTRVEALNAAINSNLVSMDDLSAEMGSLADVDTTPIREQLVSAGAANDAAVRWAETTNRERSETAAVINRKVRANRAKATLRQQFQQCEHAYKELTKGIEALDREKASRMSGAKFPVPDLGFGLHGVTYKGLPFEQASSAERLVVSTAMAISLFPPRPDAIKLLLVRDGTLLDDSMLKIMTDLAVANDCQLWLEIVSEQTKPGRVIIEDGMVKEAADANI